MHEWLRSSKIVDPTLRHRIARIVKAAAWTVPKVSFVLDSQGRSFWADLARLLFLRANVDRIPIVTLDSLYPEIQQQEFVIGQPGCALGFAEQVVIARLIKHLEVETVFEMGTAWGGTALLAAQNLLENGRVYTLDLPSNRIADRDNQLTDQQIGMAFHDWESEHKVVQLWGDTMIFDYSRWLGKIDLVFVDACHDYEFVKVDSEHALRLLSPRGVILWHDYPSSPGVTRALNEFARQRAVYTIQCTRMALYDPRPQ